MLWRKLFRSCTIKLLTSVSEMSSGHFGLFGMKERAEKVKGELTIESQEGLGTAVKLRVPTANAMPRAAVEPVEQ